MRTIRLFSTKFEVGGASLEEVVAALRRHRPNFHKACRRKVILSKAHL